MFSAGNKIFVLILFLGLFAKSEIAAQIDYHWWNVKHNFDGYTHWPEYLTLSPAYMGPNALPVPEHTMAEIGSKPRIESSLSAFFGKGDNTFSNNLKISIPLREIVQIDVYGVPVEYFFNDTITRDERAIRYRDSRGTAFGDIYFSTNVLLMKQKDNRPDISFRFAFRTASGSNLECARYTDTPGYFFDVSAGKSFPSGGEVERIRLFAMAGFYVWQTYYPLHPQNDAFLYGIGGRFNLSPQFTLHSDFSGYIGYLNNGDRPMILRTKAVMKYNKISYLLSHTYGLIDYPYHGISSGIIYNFAGR